MSVEAKIRQIITDNANDIDGNQIPLDAKLMETGLDSLDVATILLEVQEEFGVTIPEDQEDDFDTLGEIVKFVEQAQS
ncbi:acyl carrier protein [Sphingomonas sp.]|jgi:acyl carrier protein|uniref:acyl carrier protein n=1 Tax=Sphingomonas sp. TaxID=28214 RepID=UPI0035C83154